MIEVKRPTIDNSINEIEELKKAIYKFDIRIGDLEKEIAKDTDDYNLVDKEYTGLVAAGEDTKADKLFSRLDQKKSEIKAKKKRLETMKNTQRQVAIDNGKEIVNKTENMYKAYRTDYHNVFQEVQNLKKKLEEKRNILKQANVEWKNQVALNSRFIDGQIRKYDLRPIILSNAAISHGYMDKPYVFEEEEKAALERLKQRM